MSLESRVRHELHGAADGLRADVEARLASTFRVAARRRTARRAGAALALAGAVAAAGLGGPVALEALTPRRTPAPAAPAPLPAELIGVYTRTIEASETSGVPALAGRYELRLRPDGRLDLSSPARFRALFGAQEDTPYDARGDLFTSMAFFDHCGEPLSYFWSVVGTRLSLSATSEEACTFRRLVFTGGPWTRIAPSP